VVSAVASLTLPVYQSGRAMYVICGVVGLVMFVARCSGCASGRRVAPAS